MKEIQRRKVRNNMEKPFPGCLGRMVNLFDLSAGVSRNKLLTDKPHCDGSVLRRSQSDASMMSNPSNGSHVEDGLRYPIVKANGTPMKMLIDQEMSKDSESKIAPPNVVAKLMGLDTLPEQGCSAANRTPSRGSQCTVKESRLPPECIEQEDDCLEKRALYQIHQSSVDVYGIWQQCLKTNYDREKFQYGSFDNNIDEKKMALVRQKFTEAKRLATDEKLRQSKEFQDALEVLSSNKELFVKFLQEPNSLFSQHSFQLCSLPASPTKKCITILRPSKLIGDENFSETEKRCENQMKKPAQACHSTTRDKSSNVPTLSNQRVDEYVQPTRIVVLKPNVGKNHGVKTVVTQQPCSSPNKTSGNLDEEAEEVEVPELGEVEIEISKQLSENQMGHRRDETLISSVFSNGYTGDESSFYKSENEYAGADISDLELMSPSSRHSWDYVNKFDSPYSISSFSRISCSPESSVCREAKKRLSERWSMMASNAHSQEQRHVRRSSSTLGEMLSLSDAKKSIGSIDPISNEEEECMEFASCLSTDFSKEDIGSSPRSLQRSKSAPVSPLMPCVRLGLEASTSATDKTDATLEKASSTKVKSSFKGKISSLFFSRNKKPSKEKRNASQCKEELDNSVAETLGPSLPSGRIGDDASFVNNSRLEECSSPALCGSSGTSPDLTSKLGMVSLEAGLPFSRHLIPGNASENLDHPSPCSVLEPPFDEDDNVTCLSSGYMKSNSRGIQLPTKSNLIDKSPPIGSISRTLTWEDSYSEDTDPYLFKPSLACEDTEEEEQKWLGLVRTLLSEAGLDDSVQCDSFFSRWHSLENPLDPSLRNNFANLSDKEPEQEAKRRQSRSNWKLIFDSVNAVLVDITGYHWSDRSTLAMSCSWVNANGPPSQALVDSVWDRLKDWVSGESRCVGYEMGDRDSNSLVVERVVGKEVVGKGWILQLQEEMDDLGKEIEGKLLEELVEETLLDLTGDDVPPPVYDLPPDLLYALASQLPPLALQNFQSQMPFELQNEDEYDNDCLEGGRKRRRYYNFDTAWKKNFNLRWTQLTDHIQPVDWQQMYWEKHLQSCLDKAAAIASLPSFSKSIGEIEMPDSMLKYIAGEGSTHFSSGKYRKLSYHCQQFGCYARCLSLQSVLSIAEICHILRNCKLQTLVFRLIRFQEQVNGLCKLLNHNRETLTSLELINCKLSSTSINSICDALLHNKKTHGILHFSISASYFDETDPVSLPIGLVSFLSSGRYLYSFKLCENDLDKNFGKLVFHTLLDASSGLSVLDLSENNMAGWLSSFNRRCLTGIPAFSMVGKSLQSLHVLNLRGNDLRKDDADNLRYALAHIPNLEALDISDNPIEDDGIRNLIPFFVEASERSFPFADLNLKNCELSCDGVTQLFNALSTLRKPLRSLSVADNSLGSSVAAALGIFLGKSIQILNVEGIGLGPYGFQELIEGVTEGSNIMNINISKNRGGIETANFLLKLLPGAPELVSVNASYNLMPSGSLDIIHSALKVAKGNLELLDLSGNKWDDQKAEVSLFEFQNSNRKIVIHSSSPTLDALYDGDP